VQRGDVIETGTRELERGTMENLLALPVHPLEVMIGKIQP
jgi:ABC-2 type transport system permease protein